MQDFNPKSKLDLDMEIIEKEYDIKVYNLIESLEKLEKLMGSTEQKEIERKSLSLMDQKKEIERKLMSLSKERRRSIQMLKSNNC